MSELRFDPINNQWVAIADNRAERPNEFQRLLTRKEPVVCPFCAGNESATPPELMTVPHGDKRQPWLIRVVPNKYPAFDNSPSACQTPALALQRRQQGPYRSTLPVGAQEVIIHTPRHVESLSQLDKQERYAGFRVFRQRVCGLRANPNIEHPMLFLNCRAEAGASLQHVHSQLIGTSFLNPTLRDRWSRLDAHLQATGETLIQSLAQWELKQQTRIVESSPHFVALCPFASRFSYQLWIIPKQPLSAFQQITDAQSDELADLCVKYIRRLEHELGDVSYNLLFHLAPRAYQSTEHWYVELFPRLTQQAGLEWGTDWWINPVPPGQAARVYTATDS